MLLHKVLQDLDPHVWVVNLGEKQAISFHSIKSSLFYEPPGNSGRQTRQNVVSRCGKKQQQHSVIARTDLTL